MPDTVPSSETVARRGLLSRWAGRLGLLLFGLVLALLLGEVLIRIFANEGPIQTFRDREIGRRFTRSWEGDVYVEEAGRVVHQRFNAEGMRDRDWPERRAGSVRVAVLGDSMVAAIATDEPRRFTSAVPDLPAARRGTWPGTPDEPGSVMTHPSEIQNWGVSGSSPALAVRLFDARVARTSPDVVVLVWFVGNDLADDWPALGGRRTAAAELRDDGAVSWLPFDGEASTVSEWLARNSRLYIWQKRMLARARGDAQEGARPGLRALESDIGSDHVLQGAWRMAEGVLRRFVEGAHAARSRPAILVLPCAEQVYDDLWEKTVRATPAFRAPSRLYPQERLQSLCQELRIHMLAVSFGTERRLERPTDHVFLGGTGHLNDLGHDLVRKQLESLARACLTDPLR